MRRVSVCRNRMGAEPGSGRCQQGRAVVVGLAFVLGLVGACGGHKTKLPSGSGETVATVRLVRPVVRIRPTGDKGAMHAARSEERLRPGAKVASGSGPVWVEHDVGGRVLLDRDSELEITNEGVFLRKGRAWVEVTDGFGMVCRVGGILLDSDGAAFELSALPGAQVAAYLVRGRAWYRAVGSNLGGGMMEPGKQVVEEGGKLLVEPMVAWEDWTGGLAWQTGVGEEAGTALGELGARRPGALGKARFPLALRSLKIKAAVRGDLVVVRMEEQFFNPASQTLEGIYRVHLPEGAMLQAFGVDRNGKVVYGYIKERERARAQYQAQVYQGSQENPALLEWDSPGVYKARIYPIEPGATRTVVLIYTQWLDRVGDARRWRFPLGAAGVAGLRIGELDIQVNVTEAGAKTVGCSSGCEVKRGQAVLRRSDFLPSSDFVVTFHGKTPDSLFVQKQKGKEGDYFLVRVPVIPDKVLAKPRPLDLAIVVDVSGGTDPGRLLVARTVVEGLLRQLGPKDRVALFGADLALRPVSKGLVPATQQNVSKLLESLAEIKVGGATDLGAVLTQAASQFEKGRTGAVIYLGDAMPTVGELDLAALKDRLSRLPVPLRLYGVAVGGKANLDLLAGLVGGAGLAMRVVDPAQAGRASLRIMGHMSRPAAFKVVADLGPKAERVYPRRPVALVAGRSLAVVGRVRGKPPTSVRIKGVVDGKPFERKVRVKTVRIEDAGDLERRWAGSRLAQLLDSGAEREELVELGVRFGLITPYTSFYVPSASDLQRGDGAEQVKKAAERAAKLNGLLAAAESKRRSAVRESGKDEAEDKEKTASRSALPTGAGDKRVAKEEGEEAQAASPAVGGAGRGYGRGAPGGQNMRYKKGAGGRKVHQKRMNVLAIRAAAQPDRALEPYRSSTGHLRRKRSRRQVHRQQRPVRPMKMKARARPRTGGGFGGIGSGGGGVAVPWRPTSGSSVSAGDQSDASGKLDVLASVKGGGWSGASDGRLERPKPSVDVNVRITIEDHRPSVCSAASKKSLAVRRRLWKERLGSRHGLRGVFEVWQDALGHCEVRSWQARRALLSAMLDRLGNVSAMLKMCRRFRRSAGTFMFLRRAILARVRRPSDLRRVMAFFGLGARTTLTMAKEMVAKLKSPALKIVAIQKLLMDRPKDWALRSLLVLLLEEMGQWKQALGMVSLVEGNPYADPDFRIQLAELLIRHEKSDQARRLLSELVEFRPRDPALRRRLGDLYRAYGWFDEAYREYKTLASFRPSDTSVLLLMAQAAAGAGRIDEALRLERRVAATADPGSVRGLARYALLWTSYRLMKLRMKARAAGQAGLERLASLLGATRKSGVLRWAKPIRIVLTWSHPSADTGLYVGVGGYRPARVALLGTLYGIEAFEGNHPDRETYRVEVRRPKGSRARVVKAELAVMWNEGAKEEKLWTKTLLFDSKHDVYVFVVRGGKVEEVTR